MEEKLQKARAAKSGGSGGRKLMVVNHNPDGSVITDTVEGECRDTGRYTMSEDDILAMMDSFFENKISSYKSLTLKHNETIKDLKEQNEVYKAAIESLSSELTKLHESVEGMKQLITILSGVIQNGMPKPDHVQGSQSVESDEKTISTHEILVTEDPPHFEGILKYDHPDDNHSEMIAITPEMVNPPETSIIVENSKPSADTPDLNKEDSIIPTSEGQLPHHESFAVEEKPSSSNLSIIALQAPNVEPPTNVKSEPAPPQAPPVIPAPAPLQPAPVPIGIIQPGPIAPPVVIPVVYPSHAQSPPITIPVPVGLPQQHTGPIVVPTYSPIVFAQPK